MDPFFTKILRGSWNKNDYCICNEKLFFYLQFSVSNRVGLKKKTLDGAYLWMSSAL